MLINRMFKRIVSSGVASVRERKFSTTLTAGANLRRNNPVALTAPRVSRHSLFSRNRLVAQTLPAQFLRHQNGHRLSSHNTGPPHGMVRFLLVFLQNY